MNLRKRCWRLLRSYSPIEVQSEAHLGIALVVVCLLENGERRRVLVLTSKGREWGYFIG